MINNKRQITILIALDRITKFNKDLFVSWLVKKYLWTVNFKTPAIGRCDKKLVLGPAYNNSQWDPMLF